MIYTVTLNPSLDYAVMVEEFALYKTNRTATEQMTPGGKGINVSKTVHALGGETLAMGIVGGATGGYIKTALDRAGVPNDFVIAEHPTRTNLKILDPVLGTTTDINEAGFPVIPGNTCNDNSVRAQLHHAGYQLQQIAVLCLLPIRKPC